MRLHAQRAHFDFLGYGDNRSRLFWGSSECARHFSQSSFHCYSKSSGAWTRRAGPTGATSR